MTTRLAQLLMVGAASLNRDVAPALALNPSAAGRVGAIGVLLILAAQEAARATDTLIGERQALSSLFAEAALAPLPQGLKQRVAEAAEREPASFRADALQEEADVLYALLIALHEHVEAAPFEWAVRLEARIWDILKYSAACRALYLPTL